MNGYVRYDWDRSNLRKIERHGVERAEVEQVFWGPHVARRSHSGHRLAWGQSASGRYLVAVYVSAESGVIRVITARDMSLREKKIIRRRRRA